MRAAAVALLLACSPTRDVVPETHDVRGADAGPSPSAGDYVYVATHPHATIGVVAVREMTAEDAKRIAEKLASDLEACALSLEPSGRLAVGAAKYTVGASQKGTGEIGEIRLAPGNDVAANALLCIAAPVRTTSFPQGSSMLLEATWNPVRSGNGRSVVSDAGGSL